VAHTAERATVYLSCGMVSKESSTKCSIIVDRSNLQLMYDDYLTNGPPPSSAGVNRNMRLQEELQAMTQAANANKRGSISSTGSGSSFGRTSPRYKFNMLSIMLYVDELFTYFY